VEGNVGNISTWITAALRTEPFFSLAELNSAIKEKLKAFNKRTFQKKDGSRMGIFFSEEFHLLLPLPSSVPYELAEWKQATVQYNYHISIASMMYSVPFEYIKRKVDVRLTEKTVEIFYCHARIASHRRLYGRKGQYSTILVHIPTDHQRYLEWDGDRFRRWAKDIGPCTAAVIHAILTSRKVEQQAYKGCMGLLRLAERYSSAQLETACEKALTFTATPSYKSVHTILSAGHTQTKDQQVSPSLNQYGITRGGNYYGGNGE
jgi:hypothetical protein